MVSGLSYVSSDAIHGHTPAVSLRKWLREWVPPSAGADPKATAKRASASASTVAEAIEAEPWLTNLMTKSGRLGSFSASASSTDAMWDDAEEDTAVSQAFKSIIASQEDPSVAMLEGGHDFRVRVGEGGLQGSTKSGGSAAAPTETVKGMPRAFCKMYGLAQSSSWWNL